MITWFPIVAYISIHQITITGEAFNPFIAQIEFAILYVGSSRIWPKHFRIKLVLANWWTLFSIYNLIWSLISYANYQRLCSTLNFKCPWWIGKKRTLCVVNQFWFLWGFQTRISRQWTIKRHFSWAILPIKTIFSILGYKSIQRYYFTIFIAIAILTYICY